MTDALGGITRADLERARIIPLPFLQPGVSAMTLGRFIFIRRTALDDPALLHHELVHVRQWREQGIVAFLGTYLAAYFRGRLSGLGHWDAYRAIPQEIEARELSGR
ncbi:MAG TPA: DUF4157 domain-containing protein [Acidimicrobiia bacterium]|nr:DUF4157 domain-containing protein [Acidimicrobiia bacterium]